MQSTPLGTHQGVIPPIATRPRRRVALIVLALATAVSFVLGCALAPVTSDFGDSTSLLSVDSAALRVLVAVVVGAAVVGAIGAAVPGLAGVAGGASLVAASLSLLFVAVFRPFFDFGVSPGPGFVFLCITIGLGAATFIVSVVGAGRETGRRAPSAIAVLGAIAGGAMALGLMLPPPDSGQSFADRNFQISDGLLQTSYLVFVGCFALAAVIGFLSRTRTGAGIAIGATLPLAWLVIAALLEIDKDGTDAFGNTETSQGVGFVLRTELHALAPIATAAVLVLAAVALATMAGGALARQGPYVATAAPYAPVAPEAAPRVAPVTPTSSAGVLPPPTQAPVAGPLAVVDDTVARPPVTTAARPVLTVGDGRRFALVRTIVVGRDPVGGPADGDVTPVAIDDPLREVSKTHLAIGLDRDAAWIEDRHSTNGVVVEGADGVARTIVPGERTRLDPGTSIVIGATTLRLEPPDERR